jgi:hypothetical protein
MHQFIVKGQTVYAFKKVLKLPKGKLEPVNQRRTDNTMG